MEEFEACFDGLCDPRAGNARHDLFEVLMIALCTVLCGGEGCTDMAEFAAQKQLFLRRFLRLRHGPPSHDTFSRVFRALDAQAFRACFQVFMDRFFEVHKDVVAIDGKSLRRSFDKATGASALHMVSAWATGQRLVLGQVAVDAKSNEITAVPELLKMLSLKGKTITADAMHCQRDIAARIVEGGGDYALALKGNQRSLFDDVRTFLDDPETKTDRNVHVDGGHGRVETRESTVSTDIGWLEETHQWPGLKAVCKITAVREIDGRATRQDRYFLLSKAFSAAEALYVIRSHWGIENGLHWSLDMVMNEDQARNRKENGPETLAVIRHMALNLIQRNKSKGSNRAKFKRAAWNEEFLLELLAPAHMR
jgi:predicted transposase YbfD/YdcC